MEDEKHGFLITDCVLEGEICSGYFTFRDSYEQAKYIGELILTGEVESVECDVIYIYERNWDGAYEFLEKGHIPKPEVVWQS